MRGILRKRFIENTSAASRSVFLEKCPCTLLRKNENGKDKRRRRERKKTLCHAETISIIPVHEHSTRLNNY